MENPLEFNENNQSLFFVPDVTLCVSLCFCSYLSWNVGMNALKEASERLFLTKIMESSLKGYSSDKICIF